MLIANTPDQKFLEAILAESKKTNELLDQLLYSMRKGTEEVADNVVEKQNKKASTNTAPRKRTTTTVKTTKGGNKDAESK